MSSERIDKDETLRESRCVTASSKSFKAVTRGAYNFCYGRCDSLEMAGSRNRRSRQRRISAVEDTRSFCKKLWDEIEPIASHAGIAIFLLVVLFCVTAVLVLMKWVFPEKADLFEQIEYVDYMVIYGLISLFGAYTIIFVTIRLLKSLWSALR